MSKFFKLLNHKVELKDKGKSNKADCFIQSNTTYRTTHIRSDLLCGKRKCTLQEDYPQVSASKAAFK